VQTINGLSEGRARWTPDGAPPIIRLVHHLTCVEWRWIDGSLLGQVVSRSEEEFTVGMDRTMQEVVDSYRARAEATNAAVRGASGLDAPCVHSSLQGMDLRYVLIHLIEETAHHAGHAESTREMLDVWRSDWLSARRAPLEHPIAQAPPRPRISSSTRCPTTSSRLRARPVNDWHLCDLAPFAPDVVCEFDLEAIALGAGFCVIAASHRFGDTR
jgi:uncharacterized damage-inducible protein DinB